jgi:O-antigen/teichoic acid export membrane protein
MMSIGPKQPAGEEAGYYSAIAFHQLLLSTLASVLVFIFWAIDRAFAFDWVASKTAAAWAICIFVVQIHEFLRRYNFTIQKSRTVFVSDVVRNVLQLLVLCGLLLRYPDVGVTGVLLAMAVCAVLGILAFIENIPSLRVNVEQTVAVAVRHVNFSKWLVGSIFLQWLSGNFFVIAAGALLGPIAVGALKASQNLIAVTHIFFQAADNVLPARAARIFHAAGRPALDRFVRRLMLLGCAGTGLVGLIFAIPAREWLTLLLGASYADYGFVVAGFAVSYTLMACAIPLRYGFLAMERTRPIFSAYIGATLFTLITSYSLITLFGLYGAVAGIIGSQALVLASFAVQYYAKSNGQRSQ